MNQFNAIAILGARPIAPVLRPLIAAADYIIAADGGYQSAEALHLVPHLLLGDYDSAPPPAQTENVVRLPAEKDDSDTHYAARVAVEKGACHVQIFGATGGRLDHTFANLQTLLYLEQHGITAELVDETTVVRALLPGTHTLQKPQVPCYISLFSGAEQTQGVTLNGLHYPLHNATLTPFYPIGVSNEFVAAKAEISFQKGILFAFVVAKEPFCLF